MVENARELDAHVAVGEYPFGVGVVDTMISFPSDPEQVYGVMRQAFRDRESREDFVMPAAYMFKDVPEESMDRAMDPVAVTVGEMDRHGIEVGLVSASVNTEVVTRDCASTPAGSSRRGRATRTAACRGYASWSGRTTSWVSGPRRSSPHGVIPEVALDAPMAYVLYAKCVELGIPVFVTVGIAGPRLPSMVQHVERIDEVMYDFPDLVLVMRHGANRGSTWP